MIEKPKWIEGLNEEDAAFLKRFALASGSLKDLAAAYGISYPTVRLRLDRLIEKIKVLDSLETPDQFERLVRAMQAEGRIDPASAQALLAAHRAEMEKKA